MIYQNVSLKKIWKLCILTVLTAAILSGCGQREKQDYDMQLRMQSGIHFLQTTHNQIKNRMQEIAAEIENRNMPEIRVRGSIVTVEIHNAEEYQAFVDCLGEYTDYHVLTLDMAETDTAIYLDEILAYHNFEKLNVYYGKILVQNSENLNISSLKEIEMNYVYAIEENMLSQMSVLQNIKIWLNSNYNGVMPVKELLYNTECANIVMIWNDDKKYELYLEEFAEWEKINAVLYENNGYLKGIYVRNEDDFNYTSYEFCGEETGQVCEAFICIKDRESYGEKYFDILEIPLEAIEYMSWSGGNRMRLEDMNFDGYRDLIFMGINDSAGCLHSQCIGFLWDEEKQRYERNSTIPKDYERVDAERKRITSIYVNLHDEEDDNIFYDEYRIYEYNGSIFTEKRLEVIGSLTEYYLLTWQYYEDGKLLKRLEKNLDEDEKLYYITYEENGIITEEVLKEVDYKNKYNSYIDLGKEYFPEFDFYWVG